MLIKSPAFHVLWTAPTRFKGRVFQMNKAEIYTLIVSAVLWRKYNGSIKLFTDNEGAKYICSNKLEWLYDGGIDTETLTRHNYDINPEIFWAAGKLIALQACQSPCVMLDTDLIVVKSIQHLVKDSDILALHPEEINPEIYIHSEYLKRPLGYIFPVDFNWNLKPYNTAFLYIKDNGFKEFYTSHTLKFMHGNNEYPKEFVSQMVFAEQRMLALTAAMYNQKVGWILDDPYSTENEYVIHLWGYKQVLRNNKKKEEIFIQKLLSTFESQLNEFPDFSKLFVD